MLTWCLHSINLQVLLYSSITSILLFLLLVIVRVVNALHKGLTVVDFVGQSKLQKSLNVRRVCDTFSHRIQVVVLVNLAPINAFLQLLFENQIEPDTSRTTITLTERMSDVHLDILVGNLLEIRFGHLLDGCKRLQKELCHCKLETALGNIHRAYLTGKVIQATKQVSVNLL